MGQSQTVALAGGDIRPILDNWFDAMGADHMVGLVFPDPAQMDDEQKARIEAQQRQAQQQARLLQIQVDHAEREIVRKEAETRAKLATAAADIRKIQSEIILNLEKAETEDSKNSIS